MGKTFRRANKDDFQAYGKTERTHRKEDWNQKSSSKSKKVRGNTRSAEKKRAIDYNSEEE